MALYLIVYDVSSHRRRRKVAALLAGYGQRVQESVFEARLDPDDAAELRARLGTILARDDRLELVPVDERGQRRVRWLLPIEPPAPVIVCASPRPDCFWTA
jgi:CRISPR-associated protein Cas2